MTNLEQASEELWNRMGDEDFHYSDFEDIANDYGVEEDDLLFDLI